MSTVEFTYVMIFQGKSLNSLPIFWVELISAFTFLYLVSSKVLLYLDNLCNNAVIEHVNWVYEYEFNMFIDYL